MTLLRSILRSRAARALPAIFLAAALTAAPQSPPQASIPPARTPSAEFVSAADEVLADMSRILSLPVKTPLKKTLRSREEIRRYVLDKMDEDREPQKRIADQKTLEKFGLIPKGFDLDKFLVDLLTEQIAGLYDPKSQEFFIADWVSPAELRPVMAHELTHALQDQHFHIEKWQEAAKPNDDAELARSAVLEGSALAAMLDYNFRTVEKGIRDLPDVDPSMLIGDVEEGTQLAKAPIFLKDELLFPYVAGTHFTQKFLQANTGWADFHKVFENPPASTQQILHPELYLKGTPAPKVALPDLSKVLPPAWKKLDENLMGEFGLHGVLKQFLGQDRAARLSPAWAGDRYAVFENEKNKRVLLVFRLQLAGEEDALRFLGQYSEALELKYKDRRNLFRRPGVFSFDTDEGGVFLRCSGSECVSMEGESREVFDRLTRALGWATLRPAYDRGGASVIKTVELRPGSVIPSVNVRASAQSSLR